MQQNLIASDPKIMMEKPVVTGTRITVELILEELAGGRSIEEILESYPRLDRAAIGAALAFGVAAVHAQWQTQIQGVK